MEDRSSPFFASRTVEAVSADFENAHDRAISPSGKGSSAFGNRNRSQPCGTQQGVQPLPCCVNRSTTMPDDLSKKGPADRSRISLLEPHEVQYWADKFNVSKERLSEAVRKVGHSVDAVSRHLKTSSD